MGPQVSEVRRLGGGEKNSPRFYMQSYDPAIRGTLSRDYWMVAKYVFATAKVNLARIWWITNPIPARRVTPPWNVYMAKFDHSWEGYPVWKTGLPKSPHLPYKCNQIKTRDHMEKGVTSPTWRSPPPCNHGWYSVTSAYAEFKYNMSVLCEAKILAVTRSFEASILDPRDSLARTETDRCVLRFVFTHNTRT